MMSEHNFASEHRFRGLLNAMLDDRYGGPGFKALAHRLAAHMRAVSHLSPQCSYIGASVSVHDPHEQNEVESAFLQVEFAWGLYEDLLTNECGYPYLGQNAIEGIETISGHPPLLTITSLRTDEEALKNYYECDEDWAYEVDFKLEVAVGR